MKSKPIFFFFILSAITFVSCDYDDDSGQPIDPTPTTFEIISESENHTILEQALIDTGLDEVLNSDTFTIFAPNDEAFNTIDISNLSNNEITNILLNHVINGNASSTDFGNGYIKTNAVESYTGDDDFIDMYVNVDGGISLNGIANVTEADFEANNGTVHVVDAVITIPTLVTLVASNTSFSNLATALTQEDLLDILSTSSESSPAPFTVFAPNNIAFENFIAEDDAFESVQDILDLDALTEVLTYHVLSENVIRKSEITDGLTLVTIQGDTFTMNTEDGVSITDQNNRTTGIIATDITSSNGIIHVLDNLLLPALP